MWIAFFRIVRLFVTTKQCYINSTDQQSDVLVAACTYFKLENNVQGARRAHDIADDRDPDAHGEIVETLDGRYLSYN